MAKKKLIYDVKNTHHSMVSLDKTSSIVKSSAWDHFTNYINSNEPTLLNWEEDSLRERWEDGQAAVALFDGEIISYISILPTFDEEKRDKLSRIFSLSFNDFVPINLYELATGWTKKQWRLKGINKALMKELIESINEDKRNVIGLCKGMTASPLLIKLGFQIIPWSKTHYTTSLTGWFTNNKFYKIRYGYVDTRGKKPYEGKNLTTKDIPTHDWDNYYHLWINNPKLAFQIDNNIKELGIGLVEWRKALQQIS